MLLDVSVMDAFRLGQFTMEVKFVLILFASLIFLYAILFFTQTRKVAEMKKFIIEKKLGQAWLERVQSGKAGKLIKWIEGD